MYGNAEEDSWYAVGKISFEHVNIFFPSKQISNKDSDMKLRPDGDKINIKRSSNYVWQKQMA